MGDDLRGARDVCQDIGADDVFEVWLVRDAEVCD